MSLSLVNCGPASVPAGDTAAIRTDVRALLTEQVAAWNRGDIEAFMDGYARTDSLRFASGGTVHRGWAATLARYHRVYPDRAAMGTLSFDRVDVRPLSDEWAVAFGTWRLQRAEDAPHGLFTLIVQRRAAGWGIVHDHTSAAASS